MFPYRFAQFAALLQQREHLHGLAQSHVVRQASAESELPQEVYPSQAVFLIRPQFPFELFGRIGGFDAVKPLQFVPRMSEGRIEISFRLSREQRIEYSDLRLTKTQMIFVRFRSEGNS